MFQAPVILSINPIGRVYVSAIRIEIRILPAKKLL
jgi:hypothetical protein